MKKVILSILISYSLFAWNKCEAQEEWVAIDGGAYGHVNAFVVFDEELYAGGGFCFNMQNPNGHFCNIVRWDGEKWNKVTDEDVTGEIYSMIEFNGDLYIGGRFKIIGNDTISNIAKLNKKISRWEKVGDVNTVEIKFLTEYNGELYAYNGQYIVKLEDCKKFKTVSGKIFKNVTALTVYKNALYYIGGIFKGWTAVEDSFCFAKYDGTKWLRLDSSTHFDTLNKKIIANSFRPWPNVVSVCVFRNLLCIASFWHVEEDMGCCDYSTFAQWDGSNLVELDFSHDYSKTFGYVTGEMYVYKDRLYAFGDFWYDMNASGTYWAKWDGKNWTVLGTRIWGWRANALCVYKNELYWGGEENKSNCIAKLKSLP